MATIRKPYAKRERTPFFCVGESMARQSAKDECDINRIMRQYTREGVLSHFGGRQPVFADVSGVDFRSSMELVLKAQNMFDALPAKVRTRFANSPELFFEFVNDPANEEEAIAMKLLPGKDESPAPPAPPAPPE